MPSLSTYNRFDVLAIEQSNETIETVETAVQNLQSLPSTIPLFPLFPFFPAPRPKWERPLPSKFVIAAMDGSSTSLKLKVELETTDTAEVNVLVDSGTTREFIDRHYAKSCGFHLLKLSKPIPVHNVDGTPHSQ